MDLLAPNRDLGDTGGGTELRLRAGIADPHREDLPGQVTELLDGTFGDDLAGAQHDHGVGDPLDHAQHM